MQCRIVIYGVGHFERSAPVGFETASKSHQRRLAVSVGFSGARLSGRAQRRLVDRSGPAAPGWTAGSVPPGAGPRQDGRSGSADYQFRLVEKFVGQNGRSLDL